MRMTDLAGGRVRGWMTLVVLGVRVSLAAAALLSVGISIGHWLLVLIRRTGITVAEGGSGTRRSAAAGRRFGGRRVVICVTVEISRVRRLSLDDGLGLGRLLLALALALATKALSSLLLPLDRARNGCIVKCVRDVEPAVIHGLIEGNGPSGDAILALHVGTDIASNGRVNSDARARLLADRRNKMAFGHESVAQTVHMLKNSAARRSRVEPMRDGIPRKLDLVSRALILDMQKKLLCHAGSYGGVSEQEIERNASQNKEMIFFISEWDEHIVAEGIGQVTRRTEM